MAVSLILPVVLIGLVVAVQNVKLSLIFASLILATVVLELILPIILVAVILIPIDPILFLIVFITVLRITLHDIPVITIIPVRIIILSILRIIVIILLIAILLIAIIPCKSCRSGHKNGTYHCHSYATFYDCFLNIHICFTSFPNRFQIIDVTGKILSKGMEINE